MARTVVCEGAKAPYTIQAPERDEATALPATRLRVSLSLACSRLRPVGLRRGKTPRPPEVKRRGSLIPRIMPPLNGVRIYFSSFSRGSAPYGAPRPGYLMPPLAGLSVRRACARSIAELILPFAPLSL